MMRIITGTARGTRLATLPGEDTRPTTEMAKEGMFSAIQFELLGAEVLDLFGGSGQLALEALSRGAAGAVIVENARRAADIVRENVRRTHFEQEASVMVSDAFSYLKNAHRQFNFVFSDPPYASGLNEKVAEKVLEFGILKPGGVLIAESDREDSVPRRLWEEFASVRAYRYGKTFVQMLRAKEE